MPTTPCPLFAAGFDWLEALLPFLFVAFWIISQVFAVFRRLQGGGQRPQQPVRIDRPRVGPQPARGGDDIRSELERQIQEFLRQATGEQARPPAAGQRRDAPPQRSQPRPAAQPPRPIEQPRAEPAPVAVRESRQQQPGAARESRRVASAPKAVPTTAAPAQRESVARHVQDAFSHDLTHERGGLAHDSQAPDTLTRRTNDLAAELAEMLRSPAATRRAILLREVLDRPVERW